MALVLLVIASGWLRLRGLGTLPPGLHFDEAAYGLLAERVRAGRFVAFFSEFNGREPLYAYLVALAQLGFGETALAERIPSALVWTLTIPTTYFAVREIFADSPRARRLAWLAALAVATSFWALHISRQGERAGLVALVGALAIGATWRGFRHSSFSWTIAGGLFGGLTLYTYLAARFFPLLAICAVGYFVLRHARSLRGAGRRARRRSWQQWRGRWRPLAAAWLARRRSSPRRSSATSYCTRPIWSNGPGRSARSVAADYHRWRAISSMPRGCSLSKVPAI